MGPKKGRRVRKIEVPTDTQSLSWGYGCRYTVEDGGEEGKRKGGRGTETEGRSEKRQIKVTQKWTQRLEERRAHLNHNPGTRRGT